MKMKAGTASLHEKKKTRVDGEDEESESVVDPLRVVLGAW
jgi:hypothetical protein